MVSSRTSIDSHCIFLLLSLSSRLASIAPSQSTFRFEGSKVFNLNISLVFRMQSKLKVYQIMFIISNCLGKTFKHPQIHVFKIHTQDIFVHISPSLPHNERDRCIYPCSIRSSRFQLLWNYAIH